MIAESDSPEPGRDQLHAVLEAALDCIICMDQSGRVQEFNPAAERTFGYKREEVIGRELADLIIPPELREAHRRGLARYLDSGVGPVLGRRIEIEGMRSDGIRILVELAITAIRSTHGPFFTAYLRDITAIRQAERRRAAQYAVARLLSGARDIREIGEQVLAALAPISEWAFASIWIQRPDEAGLENVAVWHLPDHSFPDFDAATRQSILAPGVGLPGRVVQSREPHWIKEVTSNPQFPRAAAAARDGLISAFAFPLHGSSGSVGAVEMFSTSLIEPDEDLLLISTALGRNIGQFIERQNAEQELQRQKQAAEAANAAKDRFIASVSHELRTPLTPVMLWVRSTLEDQSLSSEMRSDLEMVLRNVGLEVRLIDDLLDFTRIGHGKIRLERQVHDVHVLLEHTLKIVGGEIETKQLRVHRDFRAECFHVDGDMTRLQQVFWNLLNNACKFTPAEGSITVRTYNEQSGLLTIDVTDTGVGMASGVIDQVFDPFEQAGSQRAGLGLGLSISKSLVQLHGGTIEATSPGEGKGSTFTVRLPLAEKPSAPAPIPPEIPKKTALQNLDILLVEDHEFTANLLARLLSREGHRVQTVRSVKAALAVIASCELDIVISDIGLPDGSGLHVIQAARECCNAQGIALSGYGQEEDVRKSMEAGFAAHLTKPVNFAELRELIQRVLPPSDEDKIQSPAG